MAAERVDAGDSVVVTFTVTAAEGSAPLEAGNIALTLTDTRPGGDTTAIDATKVIAGDGSTGTASGRVEWPLSTESSLWVVRCVVTDDDASPREVASRWFYVVGALG